MKHKTKDGKEIELKDLETGHLINIINWIERKAKEGLIVIYGGSGSSAEDMWCDTDVLFGKKVLNKLKHKEYVNELKRR